MQLYRTLALVAIPLMALLSSCSKDDDDDNSTGQPYTSGTWVVHLFTDSGTDETSDYAGYDFVFATDGKFTATKSGTVTTGTWSKHSDDGFNKLDLNLVTTDENLEDINNDWIIVSATNSMIQLADDNEASGEVLHFSKK